MKTAVISAAHVLMILPLLISSVPVFAGGAVNKTNWSAEYFRTLNRNAAVDSADIVVYNPAGTVKMEDGLYLNASMQSLAKDYENSFLGRSFEQDEPSWVPGVYALFKKARWAGFFGFNVVGGGGKVKYDDGNFRCWQLGQIFKSGTNRLLGSSNPSTGPYDRISDMNLDSESYALGYQVGAAFRITDFLSASLSVKFVDSEQEIKGNVAIGDTTGTLQTRTALAEVKETASGWGAGFGMDFFPFEGATIGLRYETRVKLEYSEDVITDTAGLLPTIGVINGHKVREDLPAVLAVGVSYRYGPLKTDANLTWYFNRDADLGLATNPNLEDRIDDGFDLGFAVEYALNPSLKASIGYLYSRTGVDPVDMKPENPELDVHTLGGGIVWEAVSNLHLNVAIGNSFYQDDRFVDTKAGAGEVEYRKNIFFAAFGFQYKFF